MSESLAPPHPAPGFVGLAKYPSLGGFHKEEWALC